MKSIFINTTGKHEDVRRYLLLFLLCCIFFVFPLHVYVIGNFSGIGIQGAVFRYQISGYGVTLIPITREIFYITSGIYSGKTAMSVIFWILGTILLTFTTFFGLNFVEDLRNDYYRQISLGLIAASLCYLISCIAQYGPFFNGPAGISMPVGILIIISWVIMCNKYSDHFFQK